MSLERDSDYRKRCETLIWEFPVCEYPKFSDKSYIVFFYYGASK